MLGQVYGHDSEARGQNLTAGERQAEPNSGLGKAIIYLLRHWRPLTTFLRVAGAPLDNNIVERALKRAVLHGRKGLSSARRITHPEMPVKQASQKAKQRGFLANDASSRKCSGPVLYAFWYSE